MSDINIEKICLIINICNNLSNQDISKLIFNTYSCMLFQLNEMIKDAYVYNYQNYIVDNPNFVNKHEYCYICGQYQSVYEIMNIYYYHKIYTRTRECAQVCYQCVDPANCITFDRQLTKKIMEEYFDTC